MNSFWLIVVIICQTGLDLFIWIVIEYYTVTIGYFMFHLYCLSFKIVVCYSVCSKHLFYRFTLVPVLIRIVILDTVPSVLIYFIVVGGCYLIVIYRTTVLPYSMCTLICCAVPCFWNIVPFFCLPLFRLLHLFCQSAFSLRIVICPTVPWSETAEPRVTICLDEVITSKVLRSLPWLWWLLQDIYVRNDQEYLPLVISTSRSFPHLWFITGF